MQCYVLLSSIASYKDVEKCRKHSYMEKNTPAKLLCKGVVSWIIQNLLSTLEFGECIL